MLKGVLKKSALCCCWCKDLCSMDR